MSKYAAKELADLRALIAELVKALEDLVIDYECAVGAEGARYNLESARALIAIAKAKRGEA